MRKIGHEMPKATNGNLSGQNREHPRQVSVPEGSPINLPHMSVDSVAHEFMKEREMPQDRLYAERASPAEVAPASWLQNEQGGRE